MSSGCGDVLSLADLQTVKKHQTFEAEVITGLQGGVAGGASIDYATNQVTGQTQKTLPAILRDAGFRPTSFDFTSGGTLTVNDRNKVVYDPVSKTWYSWSGVLPKVIPAGTNPVVVTDWIPQTDPSLRADLASNSPGKGAGLIGTTYGFTVQQMLSKLKVAVEFNAADYKTGSNTWSDAINAALAAAKLSSSSSVGVRIPASATAYPVSNIIVDSPVHLYGDGKINTTLRPAADGNTCIKVTHQFARISELSIQSTEGPTSNSTGIELNTSLITVDNCSFAFLKYCIYSNRAQSAAELDIRHNRFAASLYGVAFQGGQINSRFLQNTFSDCKCGLFVTEDLSGGVASTTEGIKMCGDLFYSCGDDSDTGLAAIEVSGTRWMWLDNVMSDLAKGVAARFDNAQFMHLTNGYYSSNGSVGSSCVVANGFCSEFQCTGVKFSDSRVFGLELVKVGTAFPGNVRLEGCTFQHNTGNAGGDLLLNSVTGVTMNNCVLKATQATMIALLDNVGGGCTLKATDCTFAGQVYIGNAATSKFASYNSPSHPDKQSGIVIIPNGAASLSVPNKVVKLSAAASQVVLATSGSAITAITAGVQGPNLTFNRSGTSGDLPVNFYTFLSQ